MQQPRNSSNISVTIQKVTTFKKYNRIIDNRLSDDDETFDKNKKCEKYVSHVSECVKFSEISDSENEKENQNFNQIANLQRTVMSASQINIAQQLIENKMKNKISMLKRLDITAMENKIEALLCIIHTSKYQIPHPQFW
jgi:hypothetical protein